ncbi:hypothetical protein [Candidatus Liberibacter sp.]|uniref:hypothetical protein n=1 Tax=Candidatus Liberibacter sp. TaxID=34022 RepID=UPI0015F44D72|nr:hypothetical protein [Candidatus Liberibacter sp.]MBA5724283.1 hypothetical protein [Candidatus Liberibacter sp.]
MISSFITGSVSKFLLRFFPFIAESLFSLYETKARQKHDMAMAQLHVDTQLNIKELESDAPLKMDKLESMKPKTKIEWIIGFNDLMRPLTTIVWVVVYPAVFIFILKYDILRFDMQSF